MPTLCSDSHGTPHAVAYAIGNGQADNIGMSEIGYTLDCMHDKQAVLIINDTYQTTVGALCARDYKGIGSQYVDEDKCEVQRDRSTSGRRFYIVRRLTPLEYCRLQGFPDWWVYGCEAKPVSGWWADNDTWLRVIDPHGEVPGSDSAIYKMWGNGMALPCMLYVLSGMEEGKNADV
jgi:DNA (cytosine-5)-methyltransferase 1